jgi:hypothetical protein
MAVDEEMPAHGPDAITLTIDGEGTTREWERLTFSTPSLVYQEDNSKAMVRSLGPAGFQITLINPSDRLRALVDGGVVVHEVKVIASGYSLTCPTQFHREWIDRVNGDRKVFGCLAYDAGDRPKWVAERQLTDA